LLSAREAAWGETLMQGVEMFSSTNCSESMIR
jgi:hypothetical protein